MNTETELRVLRMLAHLEGGYLHMERYGPSLAAQLKDTGPAMSAVELHKILRDLEDKGLAASIHERLDGLIFALTRGGRLLMEREGLNFKSDRVHQTRELFEKWLCKESM